MAETTHAEVLGALKALVAETSALFGIAEYEVREAVGNTNAAVLKLRLDEAVAVIRKAEGR